MDNDKKASWENVEAYIAAQPPDFQPTLRELRALIRAEVPTAEEGISYGIPTFKYHYGLVGFGVTKRAVSFYPMSSTLLPQLKPDLQGAKLSGTTLHFPPGEPLPAGLIQTIVRARMRENEARAALKPQKQTSRKK